MAIGCGTTVIYVGFKATAVVLAHSSPISTAVEAGVGETGSSLFGVAYGDCDVSVVTVLGS